MSLMSLAFAMLANTDAYANANTEAPSPSSSHPDPTPLLTFTMSKHFAPQFDSSAQFAMKKRLDRVTFELSRDPPPDMNCAQTLGAKRFATLFDDLGGAYTNMGDDARAADAFAKAISCDPRSGFLHAELAAALLDSGRYSEARAETQRQLSLGRADFTLYTLITQLDFIEDRWAEAVTDARLAAMEAPDDEQATYWQCFLWLAQKRIGTEEPVLAKRRITTNWPGPVLDTLQGKITEAELVDAIKSEQDAHRQREVLTEALFYTGYMRLAAHHVDEAVSYLTAAENLKVLYFIEHHLAVAELQKLRHRD